MERAHPLRTSRLQSPEGRWLREHAGRIGESLQEAGIVVNRTDDRAPFVHCTVTLDGAVVYAGTNRAFGLREAIRRHLAAA